MVIRLQDRCPAPRANHSCRRNPLDMPGDCSACSAKTAPLVLCLRSGPPYAHRYLPALLCLTPCCSAVDVTSFIGSVLLPDQSDSFVKLRKQRCSMWSGGCGVVTTPSGVGSYGIGQGQVGEGLVMWLSKFSLKGPMDRPWTLRDGQLGNIACRGAVLGGPWRLQWRPWRA